MGGACTENLSLAAIWYSWWSFTSTCCPGQHCKLLGSHWVHTDLGLLMGELCMLQPLLASWPLCGQSRLEGGGSVRVCLFLGCYSVLLAPVRAAILV
jgi:pheromone shutdown protein TraB